MKNLIFVISHITTSPVIENCNWLIFANNGDDDWEEDEILKILVS